MKKVQGLQPFNKPFNFDSKHNTGITSKRRVSSELSDLSDADSIESSNNRISQSFDHKHRYSTNIDTTDFNKKSFGKVYFENSIPIGHTRGRKSPNRSSNREETDYTQNQAASSLKLNDYSFSHQQIQIAQGDIFDVQNYKKSSRKVFN